MRAQDMRSIRLFLALFIAVVVAFGGGSAVASFQSSKTWFDHLSMEDRLLLQGKLVLLGLYSGLIDGEFGAGTFRALETFQKQEFAFSDGVLTPSQSDLLDKQAAAVFGALGMTDIFESEAGVDIVVPKALLTRDIKTRFGKRFTSPDGSLSMETMRRALPSAGFSAAYASAKAPRPGLVVKYSTYTENRFVISGLENGSFFYLMTYNTGDTSVGYRVTWTNQLDKVGPVVATFAASTFSPSHSRETSPVAAGATETPTTPAQPEPAIYSGSGFFFAPSGMLVTNAHVVNSCATIEVPGYGEASVLKADKEIDLAALQLKSGRSPAWATIRESAPVLGEDVIMLGYPLADLLNSSLNVGTGIVSAETMASGVRGWFTTNTGIQPGNSGGPILDGSGLVVGVAVAKVNDKTLIAEAGTVAPNVGFAISSPVLLDFLSIFQHGAEPGGQKDKQLHSTKDLVSVARRYTVQIICRQ